MRRFGVVGVFLVGILACSTTPIVYPPTPDHAASHRVAELMVLNPGAEFPASNPYYRVMIDSGIPDSEFRAGQVAYGRVYCCGGPNEFDNKLVIFVPSAVEARAGDVVEVRMGRVPSKNDAGRINSAIRVRDRGAGIGAPRWGHEGDWSERACRWVPERQGLWARILYCDWMEREGWIHYTGFWETWMKRPAAGESYSGRVD